MSDDKNCSNCPQHEGCKSTYEKLGKAVGSFVALRAIAAFLVPILIFILSLGLFPKILGEFVSGKNWRTLISVALGALICFIYVLIFRFFSVHFGKRKDVCGSEQKELKNRS